ncbi:DUF2180 family protein [Streptacidiphilus sp. 4-A2]|nr:DUF2180 family protein [Streptacidiphilus sp. 4-A2]
MNCLLCTIQGQPTAAVAVCNRCGAAVCPEHCQAVYTPGGPAGHPGHHRPRRVYCTECAGAGDGADEQE